MGACNSVQVMSSVDLARLCVGDRTEAHKEFMNKAKKVLKKDMEKFFHISKDSYGKIIIKGNYRNARVKI